MLSSRVVHTVDFQDTRPHRINVEFFCTLAASFWLATWPVLILLREGNRGGQKKWCNLIYVCLALVIHRMGACKKSSFALIMQSDNLV